MPKAPAAPEAYACPYREACPHLQGLPVDWLWRRHQEDLEAAHQARRRIDELVEQLNQQDRQIVGLARENAEVKAQLQALHQAQFQRPRRPDKPAPGAPPQGQKKRGAPSGHPPWNRRPPDHVNRTVAVAAPQQCPHCQCSHLLPSSQRTQHLQEDIVLCPQTWVVCFDHAQAWCPECRRDVLQAAAGELLGAYIGPVAKSAAVYLRYGIGRSYRNVQKIFTELFGLSMVPASVVGFDRSAWAKAQGLYEDLHQKIQASEYLHADETSWPVDGTGAWLWYAGHSELAYFHVDAHRSGEVAQAVIGPQFEGVLNTDDYAAYNGVRVSARQSCLAHPLRAAREAQKLIASLEDQAPVDQPAKGFIARAKEFLQKACQIGRQLRDGVLNRKQGAALKRPLGRQLRRLCARELAWEPAEALRCRLWKQRGCLLTFLDHPPIEPTNNQAEQSLRRSVILRKLTFGSRSPEGAQRHAVLTSVVMTAQRQGRDARAAVEALFTQTPAVARKAFYRREQPKPKRGRQGGAPVRKNEPCRHSGKDPPVSKRSRISLSAPKS